MKRVRSAIRILDRLTGTNPALKAAIATARTNMEIAQMIYDARTTAGLSQRELAVRIGSKQPVIARLEDADYRGHSLSILQRIAEVLHQDLEVRFVPKLSSFGTYRSRLKNVLRMPKAA